MPMADKRGSKHQNVCMQCGREFVSKRKGAKTCGVKVPGGAKADRVLGQALAVTIAGNEANTILANDGRILNGGDGYDPDGVPQNV
jgi:hypothetical protein